MALEQQILDARTRFDSVKSSLAYEDPLKFFKNVIEGGIPELHSKFSDREYRQVLLRSEAARLVENLFDAYLDANAMNALFRLKPTSSSVEKFKEASEKISEARITKSKEAIVAYKSKLIIALPPKINKYDIFSAIYDYFSFISSKPSADELDSYAKNPDNLDAIVKAVVDSGEEQNKKKDADSSNASLEADVGKSKTAGRATYRDYLGSSQGKRMLYDWAESNLEKRYTSADKIKQAFVRIAAETYRGMKEDTLLLKKTASYINWKANAFKTVLNAKTGPFASINKIKCEELVTVFTSALGIFDMRDTSISEQEIGKDYKKSFIRLLRGHIFGIENESHFLNNEESDIYNSICGLLYPQKDRIAPQSPVNQVLKPKADDVIKYKKKGYNIEGLLSQAIDVDPLLSAIDIALSHELDKSNKEENVSYLLNLYMYKEESFISRSKVLFLLNRFKHAEVFLSDYILRNRADISNIKQVPESLGSEFSAIEKLRNMILKYESYHDNLTECLDNSIFGKMWPPTNNLLHLSVSLDDIIEPIKERFERKGISRSTLFSLSSLIYCSEIIRNMKDITSRSFSKNMRYSSIADVFETARERLSKLGVAVYETYREREKIIAMNHAESQPSESDVSAGKISVQSQSPQQAMARHDSGYTKVIYMDNYLKGLADSGRNDVDSGERANAKKLELYEKAREYMLHRSTNDKGEYNKDMSRFNNDHSYSEEAWESILQRANKRYSNLPEEAREVKANQAFIEFMQKDKQKSMISRRHFSGLDERLTWLIDRSIYESKSEDKSKSVDEAMFIIDSYIFPSKNIDDLISFWEGGVASEIRRLNFPKANKSNSEEKIISYANNVNTLYFKKHVSKNLTIDEKISCCSNMKTYHTYNLDYKLKNAPAEWSTPPPEWKGKRSDYFKQEKDSFISNTNKEMERMDALMRMFCAEKQRSDEQRKQQRYQQQMQQAQLQQRAIYAQRMAA